MNGLTSIAAAELLKEYGPNVIAAKMKDSLLKKFFQQFANFLVILLLAATGLSFFTGDYIDGSLILLIIILNALFGLYQEQKAEEAVNLLKKMSITKVRVMRDGAEVEIDSQELVPGDIVIVEEGVKISADAEIVQSKNLEINEAALTGESIPVTKSAGDEVFMGTIVTKGRGVLKVVSTGMKTKFGAIAAELASLEETQTPLQKKLAHLTEIIGFIGIIISVLVFFLSSWQGHGYLSSFLLAVSLAVAVVPEGLPAVMTITLSIGIKAMAKKNAIIRKLAAIEALGSITLIATDKTGTLTTNRMEVKHIWTDGNKYDLENHPQLNNRPFHLLVTNGIVCSTASLVFVHDHGSFEVLGDPTEGALLLMGKKVGADVDLIKNEWKLEDESPFDSVTKRMSMTAKKESEILTFTKGAPESILKIATHVLEGTEEKSLTEAKREEIDVLLDSWQTKGLRILGFSLKKGMLHANGREVLLGFVALHDPPRPEARDAITKAHTAGIKVIMITGDNAKTAEAIGTHVGLVSEGDIILTGEQVENYSDEELLDILPKVRVFARVTPFHKSRIVSLYQKSGEIVAVTGDGVNDAIALKQADVGIAMGRVGTDVARETADMVITDDNFATIVNSVEEGRNIVKNLRNSIKYLFAGNLTEALTIVGGLLIGLPPLLIPIQLLFINLLSDGIPALVLAFSPREKNLMKEQPNAKLQILSSFDISYIGLVGLTGAGIVIGSYFAFLPLTPMVSKTAVFAVLTMIQSFIFMDLWLSHRKFNGNYKLFGSKLFLLAFFTPIVSQLFITQIPLFAHVFELRTVPIYIFGLFLLICFTRIGATYIIKGFLK